MATVLHFRRANQAYEHARKAGHAPVLLGNRGVGFTAELAQPCAVFKILLPAANDGIIQIELNQQECMTLAAELQDFL